MNVLITGGAGFIGSRLAARLLAAGDTVTIVDDLSLGRRDNLPTGYPTLRFIEMDVCSPEFVAVLSEAAPDRIYHLAANSDILRGTSEPRTDLDRTFLTTFALLDAVRKANLASRELVFASTSAIYGEATGALREDHGPLAPISLYGAAKLASEAYLSAYCHLYKMRAWVFRFPNVVGPNLTHGAIYDFVQRLARDKTRLGVLGNGTQTKPYLDVDDLLDAIALGVAHPAEPVATYNVAGDGLTSVREIAEMVREGLELPDAVIEYGSEDRGWPGDVPRFAYDTARIRSLGWSPRWNSREAVWHAVLAEVKRCRRSS
jgi:UDP-glucose 4-epimerase